MEEFVYYGELFDLYDGLLTEKQRNYFKDYYFENLSLGEMALNYGISRNAIFKQIHNTVEKLKEFESILHLYEQKNKLKSLLLLNDIVVLKKELEELI